MSQHAEDRYGHVRTALGGIFLLMSPLFNPAFAGDDVGSVPITVLVTASPKCSIDTPGLNYDFSSLHIGVGDVKAVPFNITCRGTGMVNVGIRTVWANKVSPYDTYTFDNNDAVTALICDQGTTKCVSALSQPFPVVGTRTLDLQLTYTTAVAETIQRKGELRVSYY
ncbi:hypothetical protein MRM75_06635 [bacterium 19CA06SA08-2]|uniref:Uncharacterized protein n=1 Tax=bacterium 19CA06SA08-2 TaxID=2920658 RepID=A0AAU6U9I5_UNCXX